MLPDRLGGGACVYMYIHIPMLVAAHVQVCAMHMSAPARGGPSWVLAIFQNQFSLYFLRYGPSPNPEGQGFGESSSPACLEEFLSLPPEGCGQLGHHAHSCTKHVWVPEIQTPILMPAHMYLQSHLPNSVTDYSVPLKVTCPTSFTLYS